MVLVMVFGALFFFQETISPLQLLIFQHNSSEISIDRLSMFKSIDRLSVSISRTLRRKSAARVRVASWLRQGCVRVASGLRLGFGDRAYTVFKVCSKISIRWYSVKSKDGKEESRDYATQTNSLTTYAMLSMSKVIRANIIVRRRELV